MIQRVVEAGVTLSDELEERFQDVSVGICGVKEHTEAIEQCAHARNRPRIEQRQQEFRVVGLQASEVVQLTHLMADDDAEVPEWIQKPAQELLFVRPNAAAEEDHQIDVGLKTEMSPAVPAQREHRDVCVGRGYFREQLPEHRVNAI